MDARGRARQEYPQLCGAYRSLHNYSAAFEDVRRQKDLLLAELPSCCEQNWNEFESKLGLNGREIEARAYLKVKLERGYLVRQRVSLSIFIQSK